MNQETREKVHEYIDELADTEKRISIMDFASFAPVHNRIHTLLKGDEPFRITTRRAFNRHRAIGIKDDNPTYAIQVVAASLAHELDPEYEWLDKA